jgi:hypothetical protein
MDTNGLIFDELADLQRRSRVEFEALSGTRTK